LKFFFPLLLGLQIHLLWISRNDDEETRTSPGRWMAVGKRKKTRKNKAVSYLILPF
jgi:hypothetical protein